MLEAEKGFVTNPNWVISGSILVKLHWGWSRLGRLIYAGDQIKPTLQRPMLLVSGESAAEEHSCNRLR